VTVVLDCDRVKKLQSIGSAPVALLIYSSHYVWENQNTCNEHRAPTLSPQILKKNIKIDREYIARDLREYLRDYLRRSMIEIHNHMKVWWGPRLSDGFQWPHK